MDETERGLRQLVEDIFITKRDELSCDRSLAYMAQCVDMGLDEIASQRQFPALWHHFRVCPDCAAEYGMLLMLTQAESEETLPTALKIPPRPGSSRPTYWTFDSSVITAFFSGFSFSQTAPHFRGKEGERQSDPINLGSLVVQLGVVPDEIQPDRYDIFCTVTTDDDSLAAMLMGGNVWLQQGEEGPAVEEQQLDEFGEAHFVAVLPGRYTLRLQVAGQTYGIRHLDIS